MTITAIAMQLTRIENTRYDLKKALDSSALHFQFYTIGSINDLPISMVGNAANRIPRNCTLVKPDKKLDPKVFLGRLLISEPTINQVGKLTSHAEAYDLVHDAGVVKFQRRAAVGKETIKAGKNHIDTEKLVVGEKLATGKVVAIAPDKLVLCNPFEKP